MLLPEPMIRDQGPSALETTVVRRGESLIVHLLSFSPERRAENLDVVEDAFPIVNMPIAVKAVHCPSRVYLAPNEQDLPFRYEAGYVHTRVTVLDGHAMLILEGR